MAALILLIILCALVIGFAGTKLSAVADVAYRQGAICEGGSDKEQMLVVVSIAMTVVLLLGLLTCVKKGLENIGFESVLVLALYGAALFVIL